VNLYDYGLGEHRAQGVGSQGFWVSTGVDFGVSVGIGLGLAIVAAVAVTAGTVAAPVAIAGVAIAGAVASVTIELRGYGNRIKDGVNSYIDDEQSVLLSTMGGTILEDMSSDDD
jgi:hypothetical protein